MRMIALALLPLAACSPTPAAERPADATPAPAATYTPGGPDDPIRTGCNTAAAKGLLGRAADAGAQAEAMRLTGARTVRVIAPGAMVTQDFRSDRLNIRTDGANMILSFDCG